MKSRQFRYYDFLVHVFVVLLLISNLVGQKISAIGPFRVSGAQVLFPITYIFGDVFTEVYGYAASRRAIWLGFFGTALLYVIGAIVIALPAAPGPGVLVLPLVVALVNFTRAIVAPLVVALLVIALLAVAALIVAMVGL